MVGVQWIFLGFIFFIYTFSILVGGVFMYLNKEHLMIRARPFFYTIWLNSILWVVTLVSIVLHGLFWDNVQNGFPYCNYFIVSYFLVGPATFPWVLRQYNLMYKYEWTNVKLTPNYHRKSGFIRYKWTLLIRFQLLLSMIIVCIYLIPSAAVYYLGPRTQFPSTSHECYSYHLYADVCRALIALLCITAIRTYSKNFEDPYGLQYEFRFSSTGSFLFGMLLWPFVIYDLHAIGNVYNEAISFYISVVMYSCWMSLSTIWFPLVLVYRPYWIAKRPSLLKSVESISQDVSAMSIEMFNSVIILEEGEHTNDFVTYLNSHWVPELYKFSFAMEDFRNRYKTNPTAFLELSKICRDIIETFIEANSEFQLNIDHKTQTECIAAAFARTHWCRQWRR
eukprot:Lithocolla_globosa_v1_NODE_85_length_6671_cov_4.306832.p3 type:complete len:393 gc:universal NODE_85_length_6671_cov_4.306832:1491-313(-)